MLPSTTRIKQTLEDINSIVRVNAMLMDIKHNEISPTQIEYAINEVVKLLEEKRQILRSELIQLLEEL